MLNGWGDGVPLTKVEVYDGSTFECETILELYKVNLKSGREAYCE